jgi:hypothetical protein
VTKRKLVISPACAVNQHGQCRGTVEVVVQKFPRRTENQVCDCLCHANEEEPDTKDQTGFSYDSY